jgi:tetratricopeptide (TPR) repeat protein
MPTRLLLRIRFFVAAVLAASYSFAQIPPAPDPTPLSLILVRLDAGDTAGARRLLSENLPMQKRRLEEKVAEFDEKFDEIGRSGATGNNDVHTALLQAFTDEVRRHQKLFDVYREVSKDEALYKRAHARTLRFEGAYYTHFGEGACGNDLNWDLAQERYHTALEKLEAAFTLARETNDVRLMASAKFNIGSAWIRLIEPQKGIQAYVEAMRYAQQMGGDMYPGLINLNLGNTYVWVGEPQKSLTYSEASLAAFRRLGRGTWQANAAMNIGNAYLRQQQFSNAWESLSLALELAKTSGEDRIRGRALLNLGMAAWQLKRPEAAALVQEALDWYAAQGKDIYMTIEREAVSQDGLRLLSQIAKDSGDEAKAEEYNKRFFEAVGPHPDRYGTLRSSPCFEIYKARPVKQAPPQTDSR